MSSDEAAIASEIDTRELRRYVEYLQGLMLGDSSKPWLDHARECSLIRDNSRQRLATRYGQEGVREWDRLITEFKPQTKYDCASSHLIFRPLLEEIVEIATSLGLGTRQPVSFASSPSIEPTLWNRSTDGVHIIFAGTGFSAFCNYWAKVLATLSHEAVRHTGGPEAADQKAFRAILRNRPDILWPPVRLALYYGVTGTVLGFGPMADPMPSLPFRIEYVEAMEVFALGI
jgi:hypothetical protein